MTACVVKRVLLSQCLMRCLFIGPPDVFRRRSILLLCFLPCTQTLISQIAELYQRLGSIASHEENYRHFAYLSPNFTGVKSVKFGLDFRLR